MIIFPISNKTKHISTWPAAGNPFRTLGEEDRICRSCGIQRAVIRPVNGVCRRRHSPWTVARSRRINVPCASDRQSYHSYAVVRLPSIDVHAVRHHENNRLRSNNVSIHSKRRFVWWCMPDADSCLHPDKTIGFKSVLWQ